MAKQTSFDQPPEGHVGILAYDLATKEWVSLLIDSSFRLKVVVDSSPTTIVIPGAGEKLIGISGLCGQNMNDTNLSGGDDWLDADDPEAGELFIVTQVSARYTGTVPTRMYVQTMGTPGTPRVMNIESPDSGRWYNESCFIPLLVGDYMRCYVEGSTATDGLALRYLGYKMAAP